MFLRFSFPPFYPFYLYNKQYHYGLTKTTSRRTSANLIARHDEALTFAALTGNHPPIVCTNSTQALRRCQE